MFCIKERKEETKKLQESTRYSRN